jgi:two-component system, LuxR family, response regulator FixJ
MIDTALPTSTASGHGREPPIPPVATEPAGHLPGGWKMEAPLVHVVDDYADFRDVLQLNLGCHGLITQGYASGEAFLERPVLLRRGVVILDIEFEPPGSLNGIQIFQELMRQRSPLPVIFLTGPHGSEVRTAVELVSRRPDVEYFAKTSDFEREILPAVQRFMAIEGPRLCAEEHDRFLVQQLIDELTPGERDVLQGMLEGKKSFVIALDLGRNERVVEEQRISAMNKLGVSRSQLGLGALLGPLLRRRGCADLHAVEDQALRHRWSLLLPLERQVLQRALLDRSPVQIAGDLDLPSARVAPLLELALIRMQARAVANVRKWLRNHAKRHPDAPINTAP